jgi:hypothetical protein
MRPGETLSIRVILPNEQRIEVPDAVVRWSRGQEFTVENLANKPHTRARLPHYVNRLVQELAEIIPWVTIAPWRFDSRSPLCCRSSVSLLPHGRIIKLAWMPITVGTTQQPCVSGDRLPSSETPGRSSVSVRSMRTETASHGISPKHASGTRKPPLRGKRSRSSTSASSLPTVRAAPWT